ncbi:MAG: FKBP-type peptidyl-prolyl cis-trans isomerase [Paludibacteraceae bacterium]|nr:FKBP-type peptidyl-prolyl cis-trans isomerase [Paludibacteraceae bacterium]
MNTLHKHILLSLCVLCLLTGCKQDDWMDWRTQNRIWLEQNKRQPGVETTHSGLQYKVLADPLPTDAKPSVGKTVNVTYRGYLINALRRDDYGEYNGPDRFDGGTANFTITEGSLIQGWVEGLSHIHNHGVIELYIPYELGYGADGYGTEGTFNYIPPYSTLVFHIEVNAIL